MIRYWKHCLILFAAFAILVPAASARPFFVGGGFYGPGFYGGPVVYGTGYGWYGPWGPYGVVHPNAGKVKIDTKRKDAMVYVDGGYAGRVGELKTFPLRVGTHDIELRGNDGHSFYQERVDVIAGKTTKLVP